MASADFTVADVLAWARTKNPAESYNYQHRGECALCQFLRDTGRARSPLVDAYSDDVDGGWKEAGHWRGPRIPYPRELEYALGGGVGLNFGDSPEWTFGGLVARLGKLCPATPVTQSDWAAIDAYLERVEA